MRRCADCNLAREVELFDGSRILVCDGGTDEMVQVDGWDDRDEFEGRWTGDDGSGAVQRDALDWPRVRGSWPRRALRRLLQGLRG